MIEASKNIDMTLTLGDNGSAKLEYIVPECGDDYRYSFTFTGELGDLRNSQALTIGYEILSWFDTLKELLEQQKGA